MSGTAAAARTAVASQLHRPRYLFERNLRWVEPYSFTFRANAKLRWVGRSLRDVFSAEFRDRPASYFDLAVAKRAVSLNGRTVESLDCKIAIGDVISHIVHRHEPPVTAAPVNILHDADGLLVVDKPASIPVHPAGRFHYNSLSEIVQAERPSVDPSRSSEHKLGLINRLDRLVSGVSIFAAGAASHRLHAIMRNNDTTDAHFTKEYIAKVAGVFPLEAECSVPLTDAIYRVGLVFGDSANGRPSSTAFKRLHTDGIHSTVACFPRTGRTHQIRVHLQSLGFPIVNDPLYSHPPIDAGRLPPSCWTDPKLKGLAIADRIRVLASISASGCFEPIDRRTDAYEASAHAFNMTCTALLDARASNIHSSDRGCASSGDGVESSSKSSHFDPWCPDCALPPRPDPLPHDMCIYLHARRYAIAAASDKFEFVAPLPLWAAL